MTVKRNVNNNNNNNNGGPTLWTVYPARPLFPSCSILLTMNKRCCPLKAAVAAAAFRTTYGGCLHVRGTLAHFVKVRQNRTNFYKKRKNKFWRTSLNKMGIFSVKIWSCREGMKHFRTTSNGNKGSKCISMKSSSVFIDSNNNNNNNTVESH